MTLQTSTPTDSMISQFVNFNRPMVEKEQQTQPLVDIPKRASEVITGKLERLTRLQGQMDILSREEESLKEDIKAYMGSCSLLTDYNGRPLVSYKTQYKTVLDMAKFKASYSELFALYSRQTSVRPFRLL